MALRERCRDRLAARIVTDRRASRVHQSVSDRRHREVLDRVCGSERLPERRDRSEGLAQGLRGDPTVKCDKGLIITFPAGYSAGSDREKAFKKVVEGKLTVIQEQPAGFMAQEGYKTASQIIPAHKNEISWVYTENDFLAEGVIQALKENGLHPGQVICSRCLVAFTRHGDTTNF